jgi:surfactin synthase thioesterase subunit
MSHGRQWIKIFKPLHEPKIRIVCFPYAGGGASVYREWSRFLPDHFELLSLQLPGREDRIRENYADDLFKLIESFHPTLFPMLNLPFVFYGHSMGALIAYEYARYLSHNFNVEPIRLFLSGRSAPNEVRRGKNLNELIDKELIEEVTSMGASKILLESPQLAELFIRTIRADLTMLDKYQFIDGHDISCPITVMSGVNDSSFEVEDLDAWNNHTKGGLTKLFYPGGHFYINENLEQVIRSVVYDTYTDFPLSAL